MIKEISGHKKAAVGFNFDNGNFVSIIWGAMTYSDNHDVDWTPEYRRDAPYPGEVPEPARTLSKTVEIMVSGNPAFERWFDKKYDGNPGGYIPVKDIPTILKRADSKLYAVIDLQPTKPESQDNGNSKAQP